MFHKLKYIIKTDGGVCADDLRQDIKTVTINKKFILSLSDLTRFIKPFSNDFITDYAIVTMSNNDRYFINKESFNDIKNIL